MLKQKPNIPLVWDAQKAARPTAVRSLVKNMNSNCPDCGNNLNKPLDLSHWWIELLHCDNSCGYFLSVVDTRNIYPLQRLDRGVGQILLKADDDTIESAIKRIKRIDHKTVSVVFFEHTLLGCYEADREYEVTYK